MNRTKNYITRIICMLIVMLLIFPMLFSSLNVDAKEIDDNGENETQIAEEIIDDTNNKDNIDEESDEESVENSDEEQDTDNSIINNILQVFNIDDSNYDDDSNLDKGTTGTNIRWYITSDYCLVIEPSSEEGGILAPNKTNTFKKSSKYRLVKKLVIKPGVKAPIDASSLFSSAERLEAIDGLENLDTSETTNMAKMFNYCYFLQEVDLTGLDTSQVTDMNNMFCNSFRITKIDLTGLDTSKVKDMSNMFAQIKYLKEIIGLNTLDTSSLQTMNSMFENCCSLEEIDLSSFNSIQVTNMKGMLYKVGSIYEKGPVFIFGKDFNITRDATYYPFHDELGLEYQLGLYNDNVLNASICGTDNIINYQSTSNSTNKYVYAYQVVLDANEGSFSKSGSTVSGWYRVGEYYDLNSLGMPSKIGATFVGWDTSKNDITTRIPDNNWRTNLRFGEYVNHYYNPAITYYAEWSDYSIELDSKEYKVITKKVIGDDAKNKTFKYAISATESYAPLPTTNVEVKTSGEGEYIVDFGKLVFAKEGSYHYQVREIDTNDSNWFNNNIMKSFSVDVKQIGKDILSIDKVTTTSFTNIYQSGILTNDLKETNKNDKKQENFQLSSNEVTGDSLMKSAKWTDKENGNAEIDLTYNAISSVGDETRAVYLMTNCIVHGYSKEIANKNILFLLSKYDVVDVMCAETIGMDDGFYKKAATFTQWSTKEDISKYLETISFAGTHHTGAMKYIEYLTDYFKTNNPDAIYLSFDGSRAFGADGLDPTGWDGYSPGVLAQFYDITTEQGNESSYFEVPARFMKTINKISEYQTSGRYYLMTAKEGDGRYYYEHIGPVNNNMISIYYADDNNVKNSSYLMMATIAPSVFVSNNNDIKEVINNAISTRTRFDWTQFISSYLNLKSNIYDYSQDFESMGLDIADRRTVTVTDIIDKELTFNDKDVQIGYYEIDSNGKSVWKNLETHQYSIQVSTDKDGNKVLKTLFTTMSFSDPIVIKIPAVAKGEFRGKNDSFKATNIGDATVKVETHFKNTETGNESTTTFQTLNTSSPKLYRDILYELPSTGGTGIYIYICIGVTFMLVSVVLLIKKKGKMML